jgi:DNA-binding CsgD family transcriptional regulator
MGIRHAKKEELERLESKTLDAQFLGIVRDGLGCSPFEAHAVLGAVKEVYFPFLDAAAGQSPPGKVTLVAVDADEPAGKPVSACQKVTVSLTVHRGPEDDRLLQEQGPAALRRARILEICQEALSQGALLTAEDLAYRVFFVTPRTISRDLAALRQAEPGVMIPMRSTVHDLGPVLTHRTEIVRLALEGKTTSEICTALRHSPRAVANYLSTFVRCVQLFRRGLQVGQIAFLLRRGKKLVEAYLKLLADCEQDRNYAYHLDELMRLGSVGGEKGTAGGACHG